MDPVPGITREVIEGLNSPLRHPRDVRVDDALQCNQKKKGRGHSTETCPLGEKYSRRRKSMPQNEGHLPAHCSQCCSAQFYIL